MVFQYYRCERYLKNVKQTLEDTNCKTPTKGEVECQGITPKNEVVVNNQYTPPKDEVNVQNRDNLLQKLAKLLS